MLTTTIGKQLIWLSALLEKLTDAINIEIEYCGDTQYELSTERLFLLRTVNQHLIRSGLNEVECQIVAAFLYACLHNTPRANLVIEEDNLKDN